MSLLLSSEEVSVRSAVARGELAPLADGLAQELAPLLARELYIPREKALLSREGGRCARDGATLDFDPFSPHRHRCPKCGEIHTGAAHDRFWIFWYQLWLIERAVHSALLGRLRCNADLTALAARIIDRYCDEYLLYPNRDNVLGPTRLFFSTYLESIWLLNLCIAVDLLEGASAEFARLGARARDQIVEPSAKLIASYDEGASNRQVWNDAALLAGNRLLGLNDGVEQALDGPSGIVYHLQNGLLADGTWYEGENYHLFAHRGLWYGITMAEAVQAKLDSALLERFQEGFVTPFLTALPDMTLPSRRDSQYAISLRQPRFAESCELGLARQAGDGDPRLRGMLYRLYAEPAHRRDTGRSRSTADVERNLDATALSRADLGWRSLLFARPELPPLESFPLGTVLLEAQGLAVFRRANDQVYVALDYGKSGGGHGHPDRLNVLLSHGDMRWLDDMGTGSYVDPSLHWYRSTLAHNAPLFNGCEQQRVDGELFAFDELGNAGWACARAFDLFPGVAAIRSLVVMEDYVLDELAWEGPSPLVMDLPIHIDAAAITIRRSTPDAHVELYDLESSLEDTFGVLANSSASWLRARTIARIYARSGGLSLYGFVTCSSSAMLYRTTGPGAPGHERRPFLVMRVPTAGETTCIRTIWSWAGAVETIWVDPDNALTVERRDGTHDRHSQTFARYRVARTGGSVTQNIDLGGLTPARPGPGERDNATTHTHGADLVIGRPLAIALSRNDYRRSEETWDEAGQPSARIGLLLAPNELIVDITVRKRGELTFAEPGTVNPYDNESPDINGDGVQLYLVDSKGATAWLLVPELDNGSEGKVRARRIDGWNTARRLRAEWRRIDDGYSVRLRVDIVPPSETDLALGIVVNEKPANRERRRGQLVLGGAHGEFVYLRGDREDRDRLPRFRVIR